MQIRNETRGTLIADKVELARTFWSRGRGLMGRASLAEGFALIIYPEWSIHTFFMRVPIDVLFVDKANMIVGLQHRMPPSRPFAGVSPSKGRYVVELPAGVLESTGTQVGDTILVDPPLS